VVVLVPNYQDSTRASTISLSSVDYINTLIFGNKWGMGLGYPADLTFSFHSPGVSLYASNYSEKNEHLNAAALTDAQKEAIRNALSSWGSVANIKFTEVVDNASGLVGDLRFGGYQSMPDGTAAWAYYPFNRPVAGDVWIGPFTDTPQPNPGSYDYLTFIHEIGHALGLKHPFEAGGISPFILKGRFDDVRYTVMSYNDTYDFQPTGPMIFDIAAMQYIYGSNNTWSTGSDVYSWDPNAQIFETIWDAGGNDTINASNQLQHVTLNLNSGEFSRIGQDIYNWKSGVRSNEFLTIAYGAVIENAIGSDFNDTLIGNDADNMLEGGKGFDMLYGGLGSDTYIVEMPTGSEFYDWVTETANQGYDRVILRGESAGFFGSSYTLPSNVEVLDASQTSNVNLYLSGNSGNNIIIGNAANNIIYGGAGIDTMIGGAGNDTYVVDNANDVVTEKVSEGIDLVQIAIATAGGAYVLGNNIENAALTNTVAFNLTGNAQNNVLTGNAANNILDGGEGADVMNGGAGNDTYIVDNVGDVISDSAGIDTARASISYTLGLGLENLTLLGAATDGTGNALANTVIGNDNNNTLDGAAGVDTLRGGRGDDRYIVDLTATNTLQDTVTELLNEGTDTVQLRGGNAALATVSTVAVGNHLENLDASATGQVRLNLTGNSLANELTGNAANNTLNGGAGNDILIGGGGFDTLIGGVGADVFRFDLAWFNSLTTGFDAQINDFKRIEGDKIQFIGQGTESFNFVGQTYSQNPADSHQLRFDAGTLYGSVDAGVTNLFEIRLLGVADLRQSDFLLG
jgi:serralysin